MYKQNEIRVVEFVFYQSIMFFVVVILKQNGELALTVSPDRKKYIVDSRLHNSSPQYGPDH